MKTKFTPGPWEVRAGSANHLCVYQMGTVHNVAVGMNAANARLIAAAPELYAALEDIAAGVDHADSIARAALAKAEG